MLDTLDPIATNDQIFASAASDFVRQCHNRYLSTASRLLSVRQLLSTLVGQQVTDFTFHQDVHGAKETYLLDLQAFKATLTVSSFHPLNAPTRRVNKPATVLAINALLKHMHLEWKAHPSSMAHQADYDLMSGLLMKTFARCSEGTTFETEAETGYWSVFFDDTRARVQAEIVVERKAV